MAIDMNEVIQATQASALASMQTAHTQQMDFQAKVFTRLEASVDLVEAAAAKELGKAGMSVDLASIRPPALPAATP